MLIIRIVLKSIAVMKFIKQAVLQNAKTVWHTKHRDFRLRYILWVKLATDQRRDDLSEENKECNEVGNLSARCARQILHFIEHGVKTRKN